MGKRLVFVSCGQCTREEKDLGLAIKNLIDETPDLESYFAESAHDFESLGRHIFDALRNCVGAVVVMHPRGKVLDASGNEWGVRSSVWVNQEIAILAYRKASEGQDIPNIVFADTAIRLEGAMTSLIVNPLPLGTTAEVLRQVKAWLMAENFSMVPPDVVEDAWERISESNRMVMAALLDAGGFDVTQMVLQNVLMKKFGITPTEVGSLIGQAKLQFVATGLASCNIQDGAVFSVNKEWEPVVRRKVKEWRARSGPSIAGQEPANPGAAPDC